MGSVKEIKETVLSNSGRYKIISDNLHAKEVIVGDGERRRRYILCYNPYEAEKQRNHRYVVIEQLTEIMKQHPCHKITQHWAMGLMASGRYKKYLKVDTEDCIAIDYDAINEAGKYDGKWVVITNDDTITIEDAACGYKSLMVIERCFRTLKRTQIKMEPMYHWLNNRIIAHVKVCVLSLLIERMTELKCEQPWSKVKDTLSTLQVAEFHAGNFKFFQCNELTPELLNALRSLEIAPPKAVTEVYGKA